LEPQRPIRASMNAPIRYVTHVDTELTDEKARGSEWEEKS
jgi:hypothetical protein